MAQDFDEIPLTLLARVTVRALFKTAMDRFTLRGAFRFKHLQRDVIKLRSDAFQNVGQALDDRVDQSGQDLVAGRKLSQIRFAAGVERGERCRS